MTLSLVWEKTVAFVKKYWKYLLAGVGFLLVLLKIKSEKDTSAEVIANTVDAGKKIEHIENTAAQQVETGSQVAEEHQVQRDEQINKNEAVAVEKAKEELQTRTEENRKDTVDELANNVAKTFGVNVVSPKND